MDHGDAVSTAGDGGPATEEPVGSSRRRIGRDISASGALATLGVIGLVMYGLAYAWASSFYGAFGLTPREVGYSYQDVVAYAATSGGFVLLVSAASLGVLAAFLSFAIDAVLRNLLPGLIRRFVAAQAQRLWRQLASRRAVALATLALVLPLGLALAWPKLVGSGSSYARAVSEPDRHPEIVLPDLLGATFAAVRVDVAEATWAEIGSDNATRSLVLLFGSHNGVTSFFDYCAKQVVRLPSDRAILRSGRLSDYEFSSVNQYCVDRGAATVPLPLVHTP